MSMQQEQGNQDIANLRQHMITSTSNATVPSDMTNNASVALSFALSNIGMMAAPNIPARVPTRVMWSNPRTIMLSPEDIASRLARAHYNL